MELISTASLMMLSMRPGFLGSLLINQTHILALHGFLSWQISYTSLFSALGYGLDDRGSRVRFPAGTGNFFHHRVQNGSGAHPASYPVGSRGSFPVGKAAWAWSWPLRAEVSNAWSSTSTLPLHLHGVVLS